MHKVLLVISNLNPGHAAKQLALLSAALPRDRFEPLVCILGREDSRRNTRRVAGVDCEFLGWSRVFDPHPFLDLRRLVRSFRPHVIHAWDWPAFRAVGLVVRPARSAPGSGRFPRIVASLRPSPLEGNAALSCLDQWLLRRVDRVTVAFEDEVQVYRRLKVPDDGIEWIPPGVDAHSTLTSREGGKSRAPAAESVFSILKLSRNTRILCCVGPLEPHRGLRNAIWAFDILRCVYEDLHLAIIGEGSDRHRLERFAHAINAEDRVHFLGFQPDVPALLAEGQVVLIPGEAEGGVNVALEAMTVGRPVIASNLAGLKEVVLEGKTGFLVPPGDKTTLARQTRRLLEDPELARRLGQAGQERAERQFAASNMVQAFVHLYESVIARGEAGK